MISAEAKAIKDSFPDKRLAFERAQAVDFDRQLKDWEDSCGETFDRELRYESLVVGMARIEKCIPPKVASETCILHFHGGGFVVGSIVTHRKFCSLLARKTGLEVWNIGYSLAPARRYPHQEHEAFEVYERLRAGGRPAIIGGDSAGGALALALANRMTREGREKPRLLYLFSPWLDLTLAGVSIAELDARDPLVVAEDLKFDAAHYCEQGDLRAASPLFADAGHPYPVHIDVGSDEILLDDSRRLYEEVRSERGDARLIVRDDMWHTYQLWGESFPERDRAVDDLLDAVRRAR
jgi:epsilon-lactone hydrolase